VVHIEKKKPVRIKGRDVIEADIQEHSVLWALLLLWAKLEYDLLDSAELELLGNIPSNLKLQSIPDSSQSEILLGVVFAQADLKVSEVHVGAPN